MPVTHELSRLAAGDPEPHAQHDAVKAPLKLLQKHFTGHTLSARSLLEIISELAFLREINPLGLLLFAQLQAVADDFGLAVFTVLAGREVTLLDRTFIAETFRPLEEQLHALAAAQTAYCIFITCQVCFSLVKPVYRIGVPSSRLKIAGFKASCFKISV